MFPEKKKKVLYSVFSVLYTPGNTQEPRPLKVHKSHVPCVGISPIQFFLEQKLSCYLNPEMLKYPVSQHTLLLLSCLEPWLT